MIFRYTEKKLAKEIRHIASTIDSSLDFEYLPKTNEIRLTAAQDDAGGPFVIFLGNLFKKVVELPKKERLAAIKAFLVESLTPDSLSPDELLQSLALRVRTSFEIDFRNRNLALLGHEAPPSIVVNYGDVLAEIVSDRDASIAVARQDDLQEIDVTDDEAIRIATAKTRRMTVDQQWEQLEDAIWISRHRDDYDFARVVAAETHAKFPFDGPPVVYAPSHSICLATDQTGAQHLSRMIEIGDELSASHRQFAQYLWSPVEGAGWQHWKPADDTDEKAIAELQEMRERATQYQESKDYLVRSLGDQDIYVGTFSGVKRDDVLTCYCVYTLNVPSYLPKTDFVFVVDPHLPDEKSVLGRVDWDVFREILGEDGISAIEGMRPDWFTTLSPLSAHQTQRLTDEAAPV